MRTTINFDGLSCKYFNTKDGIGMYLNNIRRYSKLTAAEEEVLVRRYKEEGDVEAREKLFLHNQRFIFSVAKRYAKDEDEVMDYVSEGNIGLSKAIDKYDVDKGYKFMTYGVWYIRRQMNFYMTDTKNAVNRSNNLKIGKKVEKIKDTYYKENGRIPSDEEIIEILEETSDNNIKIKNVEELYDVGMISINENLEDDYTVEDDALYNSKTATINEYEDTVEKDSQELFVKKLVKQLNPLEMKVISMKFGLNGYLEQCIEDIADEFGMSQTEITKIIQSAIGKMKTSTNGIMLV